MTVFSMRGMAALALVCAASAVPAEAQQPTPQQQQQKEHVVRKGDTLWDLARFYLNDPFRWPRIYEANRAVVENPHWIYPAEKIIIPGMVPDGGLLGVPIDTVAAPVTTMSNRSRFYVGPATEPDHATVISSEVLRIPLVQPLEWLGAPWISDSASLGIIGTVFKPADPRFVHDRLAHVFHPRDKLFLSANSGDMQKGQRLLVVRLSRNLRDYGWIVEPKGILHIDSIGPNTAIASVTHEFGDLKVGDLVMPLPAVPAMPADRLTEVTGGPTGHLIDMLTPQPLPATTDYGFVNLGASQGISLGDEILAFIAGHRPNQQQAEILQEQAVAKMRVIKVTNGTATVRITRMHNAALKNGLPVRVARKAP